MSSYSLKIEETSLIVYDTNMVRGLIAEPFCLLVVFLGLLIYEFFKENEWVSPPAEHTGALEGSIPNVQAPQEPKYGVGEDDFSSKEGPAQDHIVYESKFEETSHKNEEGGNF
jgi:hypothetical protein